MDRICFSTSIFVVVGLTLLMPGPAGAVPRSDFDDGTLQGWTRLEPFNGNLLNPGSGGNPGGFMKCEDTMAGGSALYAVAPPEFTGNLSGYTGIQWDEYLYYCSPAPSFPTFPSLFAVIGGDTTIYYERARPVGPLGVWQPRSVPFTASAWERYVGTASFEEVLANVTELRISMDCNTMCRNEAGVDNIELAPSSPSPPDPTHCTVAPWDGRTNAFVTPGNQSNVDQLTVTVRDESGLPLAAMPVEIVFTGCEVCLDSGDAGLRGTTNAAGSVTLRPRAGGCDECAVRVYAGDVPIRNFTRFVSTDWDGTEADGVVNARDAQYVQTALMTGDLCADFDGNGMVNIADLSIFMVSLNSGDANAAGCATAALGEEVVAPPAAAPRLALTPNPVRQGAPVEITFQVAGSSSFRLEVFTASGRHVATLVDGRVAAGIHRQAWETRDPASGLLAAGVYFLHLSGNAGRATQKLVVLR